MCLMGVCEGSLHAADIGGTLQAMFCSRRTSSNAGARMSLCGALKNHLHWFKLLVEVFGIGGL